MEPKKNPKHDVHRHRNALLSIGLMCSLAIVIMAFEWKAEIHKKDLKPKPLPQDMVYNVPITYHIKEEKTPEVKKKLPVSPTEYVEVPEDPVIEIEAPDLDVETIEMEAPASQVSIVPEKIEDEPFIRVEVMPEPKLGYPKFYEAIGRSLRYPRPAQRQGVEGKVVVQFVVNEKGEPIDMEILQGIGAGCDEEAIRVLKLFKWKPGKQRGVPVKVRMQQSIGFTLNR